MDSKTVILLLTPQNKKKKGRAFSGPQSDMLKNQNYAFKAQLVSPCTIVQF